MAHVGPQICFTVSIRQRNHSLIYPFWFQSTVQRVNISVNVDNPEGTLDALMQIAVCDKVKFIIII